jgi:hypothetical protein
MAGQCPRVGLKGIESSAAILSGITALSVIVWWFCKPTYQEGLLADWPQIGRRKWLAERCRPWVRHVEGLTRDKVINNGGSLGTRRCLAGAIVPSALMGREFVVSGEPVDPLIFASAGRTFENNMGEVDCF